MVFFFWDVNLATTEILGVGLGASTNIDINLNDPGDWLPCPKQYRERS